MFKRSKKALAQSMLEYTLILGTIVVALLFLQPYIAGAIKGNLKGSADDIGPQFVTNPNTDYSIETKQLSVREETSGLNVTDGEWARSEIAAASEAANFSGLTGARLQTAYQGHEITQEDYVTATVGAQAVGTHVELDIGDPTTKKLFEDKQ